MTTARFKWLLLGVLQLNLMLAFIPSRAGDSILHKIATHPLYVSVTEINHNLKDKTLEISCKMFAEDFENALKAQYKTNIDITHPKDPRLVEKYVFEYLQKHLQLKLNGKAVTLQFVGYEKEEEAVWGYLQVSNVLSVKKIEIMNNVLYESYNSQISIMHAEVGGTRKSTRLVYPDTQASFEF